MPFDSTPNPQPAVRKLISPLLGWFSANARDLPWRRTRDPYVIWVSEVMLQQTQVKSVVPYWERWMRELPSIEAAANASSAKLHKLWEGLGYYPRVRNLQKAAKQIVAQHGGRFPTNFHDILALPGIGRYTVGAICSIAFNRPVPILDGNVIRVLTRIFGITSDPRRKDTNARLWQLATELVVHASRITHHVCPSSHLNQSLMELGALICTPRNPRCDTCPVKRLCVALRENRAAELPNLGRRAKTTNRRFVAFVVERKGKFLVRQRPPGVLNAHLWEFPNFELGLRPSGLQRVRAAARALGLKPSGDKPLCVIKHSITRYRITLQAVRAELANPPSPRDGHWLSLPRLHKLAFTSAHKKILHALTVPHGIGPHKSRL